MAKQLAEKPVKNRTGRKPEGKPNVKQASGFQCTASFFAIWRTQIFEFRSHNCRSYTSALQRGSGRDNMSGKDSKGATEEVIEEINVEDGSDPAYQLDPGTNRSHPVDRYSIIGGAYTA